MKGIRISVLMVCACLLPMAWGQQPASKGSSNWTQFHRANMRRYNPYEHVLNVHNVGRLRLKWSYAVRSVETAPAVVNGVVYVSGGLNDSKAF